MPGKGVSAAVNEDYHQKIVELSRLDALEKPLLTFNKFHSEKDREIESVIFQAIVERVDLLDTVKKKIGHDKPIHLKIESIDLRLLFVPESRDLYANAYQQYCRNIISYIFDQTGINDFYAGIVTPRSQYPSVSKDGVTAFLVHQFGKEYVAVCTFSNDSGKKVRYRIKGAVFSGHKGAVNLMIENPASDIFLLKRRNFTIWQNHTDNLFTLFAVPVEETLHYILGPYTDKKIHSQLLQGDFQAVADVQQLADHWMMVEEAVVGGLVNLLLEGYALKYGLPLSHFPISADISAMKGIPQFKYRPTGIQWVRNLGCSSAIQLYREDPGIFERRFSQINTVDSTQEID